MIEMTAEVRDWIGKFAEKSEPREDEYIDPADGLLHCEKCGGLRQTVISDLLQCFPLKQFLFTEWQFSSFISF